MKIESLRELDKLMQLCKKRGVEKIKIDNIEFTIDASPVVATKRRPSLSTINPYDPTAPIADNIQTPDELTPEQLLFYSSGEQPGETA